MAKSITAIQTEARFNAVRIACRPDAAVHGVVTRPIASSAWLRCASTWATAGSMTCRTSCGARPRAAQPGTYSNWPSFEGRYAKRPLSTTLPPMRAVQV